MPAPPPDRNRCRSLFVAPFLQQRDKEVERHRSQKYKTRGGSCYSCRPPSPSPERPPAAFGSLRASRHPRMPRRMKRADPMSEVHLRGLCPCRIRIQAGGGPSFERCLSGLRPWASQSTRWREDQVCGVPVKVVLQKSMSGRATMRPRCSAAFRLRPPRLPIWPVPGIDPTATVWTPNSPIIGTIPVPGDGNREAFAHSRWSHRGVTAGCPPPT